MSTEKHDQLYFENEAVKEFVQRFRGLLLDAYVGEEDISFEDVDDVLAEALAAYIKPYVEK